MRILFLGDYSNLHACLAKELKKRGHDVTVVSDGGRYMDTQKDILLDRRPGRFGAFRYLYELFSILPSLRDYDAVQLINPHFLSLRPGKLQYFFKILKRQNRSIFLTLAGDDYNFVSKCLDGKTFRFSEFRVGDTPTEFETRTGQSAAWNTRGMKEYNDFIFSNIDGAMSVLPEYDMAARPLLSERLAFTNIPVDLSELSFSPMDISGKIRLFIGIRSGMEIRKGTAYLLDLCRRLEREMPDRCVTECVRDLPLREYLQHMASSHIVLDQLYSYSPGTNGFQAMALGRVAGTGAQPEFYEYIGETQSRPIFTLSPLEDTETRLRELILNPEKMPAMGAEGRRIVEKNNDVAIVADRFLNHWNNILK